MGVTYEADGRIGVITLDNPPANSYDLAIMEAFADAVDQAVGLVGDAHQASPPTTTDLSST